MVKSEDWHVTGNIPAHAGKTGGEIRGLACDREHPRARGENRQPSQRRPFGGDIPAHAGKTGGNDIDRRFWEEHPRARGENLNADGTDTISQGTSPRTRGKPYANNFKE